jgi:hypothetical protein
MPIKPKNNRLNLSTLMLLTDSLAIDFSTTGVCTLVVFLAGVFLAFVVTDGAFFTLALTFDAVFGFVLVVAVDLALGVVVLLIRIL